MINRAVLTGRLTRDPELRTTGSGIAVATFTIAVDRRFKNADGERGTDFINCVIWRKSAENFCNFTHKGSLVGIDGRIQTRTYDNKDGQRVYVTEVVVDNFTLLETRKQEQERNNGTSASGQSNGNNSSNANNGNYTNNGYNAANNGQGTVTTTTASSDANNAHETNAGASATTNTQTTTQTKIEDPFSGSGDTITITDDDLPF